MWKKINQLVEKKAATTFQGIGNTRRASLGSSQQVILSSLQTTRQRAFSSEIMNIEDKKGISLLDHIMFSFTSTMKSAGSVKNDATFEQTVLKIQKLFTEVNCRSLLENTGCASQIGFALGELYKGDPTLVTGENVKLLVDNAIAAGSLRHALKDLHQVAPTLFTDQNFKLLAHKACHARDMVTGLKSLHQVAPELANQENLKLLAQAEEPFHVTQTVSQLKDLYQQQAEKRLTEVVEYSLIGLTK